MPRVDAAVLDARIAVGDLAARLCGEAKGGQILVSSRVASALKGFLRPIPTFSLLGLK